MLLIIPKLYQLKGSFGVLFPYKNSVSEFGHAISFWAISLQPLLLIKIKYLIVIELLVLVRLSGIEPPHAAPEATALSTELQAYACLLRV